MTDRVAVAVGLNSETHMIWSHGKQQTKSFK